MNDLGVRAALTARLLAGFALPLVGHLLADTTRKGEVVALDPETGGELSERDERPAFVISTESEATDGHIVRQEWDLSRGGSCGIPVLWNHDQDVLLGRWQDLAVHALDAGPSLVGRVWMDPDDELAQKRRGQIRRGFLNAVSAGWVPGETTRRGELPEDDPAHRAAQDDECGLPCEGLVMGSKRKPNLLCEASIVPVPAQQAAVVLERRAFGAVRDVEALVRGAGHADMDRLLAELGNHPRVRGFLASFVASEVERRVQDAVAQALASLPAQGPPPPAPVPSPAFDLLFREATP